MPLISQLCVFCELCVWCLFFLLAGRATVAGPAPAACSGFFVLLHVLFLCSKAVGPTDFAHHSKNSFNTFLLRPLFSDNSNHVCTFRFDAGFIVLACWCQQREGHQKRKKKKKSCRRRTRRSLAASFLTSLSASSQSPPDKERAIVVVLPAACRAFLTELACECACME